MTPRATDRPPWRGVGGGELELAVDTAHRAGALLVDAFGNAGHARRKGAYDVVTALDRQSEGLIMGALGSAFPADRRLGEETGSEVPRRPSTRTWIVDPLDGTVNFASGLPFWCVSIALAIDEEVVLGVTTTRCGRRRSSRPQAAARGATAAANSWRFDDPVAPQTRSWSPIPGLRRTPRLS